MQCYGCYYGQKIVKIVRWLNVATERDEEKLMVTKAINELHTYSWERNMPTSRNPIAKSLNQLYSQAKYNMTRLKGGIIKQIDENIRSGRVGRERSGFKPVKNN